MFRQKNVSRIILLVTYILWDRKYGQFPNKVLYELKRLNILKEIIMSDKINNR